MSAPTKPRLSLEAVVDTALAIADTEGLGKLTIRRVADAHEVTPMALYWHVKNKDELLAAVADRVVAGMRLVELDEPVDALEAGLRPVLDALLTALQAHPNVADLVALRVLATEPGQVLAERALAALRAEGFSVEKSAELSRIALETVMMLVRSEQDPDEIGLSEAALTAKRTEKMAALQQLPADRFPNLIAAGPAMVQCDSDEFYADGIALYLAGVRGLRPAR